MISMGKKSLEIPVWIIGQFFEMKGFTWSEMPT
jgi:hypothetical protein